MVEWYHNRRLVEHSTRFGNTLFIVKATDKDRGTYQCVGKGKVRSLEAYLFVAGK